MSIAETIQQTIEQKLAAAFAPEFLLVENESHMHSGPATDSPFKVTLAADSFQAKRKVARHQAVYALLQAELAGPVHALALHLYSPDEWAARDEIPESPLCASKQPK